MPPRERIVRDVRELLEQKYLQSISGRSKREYAELSEAEKREVLKAFLQKRIAGSATHQWAKVLQEILVTNRLPHPDFMNGRSGPPDLLTAAFMRAHGPMPGDQDVDECTNLGAFVFAE